MKRDSRFLLLLLLTLFLSCGDDTTGPENPVTNPPAALAVIAPDTVQRGVAFALRIDALDETGLPAGWSGTVTLSASAGTVSPTSVQLVNGTATVQATLGGQAGAVTVTAAVGALRSDPAALTVLSSDAPARIEIVPAAALLPGVGETMQLEARAYDASGAPTLAQVTWRTTNGAAVVVGNDGLATAQGIGSAQVIAAAQGVESAPAVVLVAQPADDVVLIDDAQIVSGPDVVDPAAPYEPGWQYRIVLQDGAPDVGSLVLGTGGTPLAGRVADSRSVSAGTELTVELVALNQLFARLLIDEVIPLVELDGARGGALRGARGRYDVGAARLRAAAADFELAGFTCESDVSAPSIDLPTPSLDITPDLGLRLRYDDALEELVVTGEMAADFSLRPVISAALTGSVSCERELRTLTVPLNGWLSMFFGVQVPVGIGFALDATVEIAEIGFDLTGNAVASAELGLRCSSGSCTGVSNFDLTRDVEFEFISPDPSEQYRVELGLQPFVFAKPKLGSAFTSALDFSLIDAQAGLKQTVDLAAPHRQVAEQEYSSSFDLRFVLDVKAADDLQDALTSLGKVTGAVITGAIAAVSREDTLATSPTGTLTIAPARVAPGDDTQLGDMATFTVQLDDATYLGLDAVDQIELRWEQADTVNNTFTLENGRQPCTTLRASPGQTRFECKADFLEEHEGKQPFHAFLHAKLFGIPLPVPLEIAVDTVTVQQTDTVVAFLETYWGVDVYAMHPEDEMRVNAGSDRVEEGELVGDTTLTVIMGGSRATASVRHMGIIEKNTNDHLLLARLQTEATGEADADGSAAWTGVNYSADAGAGGMLRGGFQIHERAYYVLEASGASEGAELVSITLQGIDPIVEQVWRNDGGELVREGWLEPGGYWFEAYAQVRVRALDAPASAYSRIDLTFTLMAAPPE